MRRKRAEMGEELLDKCIFWAVMMESRRDKCQVWILRKVDTESARACGQIMGESWWELGRQKEV